MLLRKLLVVNLVLAGVISINVHADELDTLQFRVGQTWQYDSNIFRLSDVASGPRSDHFGVTTLGAKIDKSYGLQRFELDINANRYTYKSFSALDFTAVNYAAAWRWSLTPSLYGNFTTDRQEYTDNTANFLNQNRNQDQLNRRTDRLTLLDAEYAVDGPWRIVGGVFERSSSNSQPLTFEGDSKIRGVEAGARYVFASDSSLAYRLKQGRGEYPNRIFSSAFASDFKDREHEFKLVWPITGKTTIQSRLSYFDRKHEGFEVRDFSGFIGQLDATWKPTGKTSINGGIARDLGDYQTNNISYYQGNRFFIAPTWKPTEKTAVKFRYDHGVRNYKGPLTGFVSTDRRDTTNLNVLSLEWNVIRSLKLTTSVFSDKRKSNESGADYKSHGVNFTVLASF